MAGWFEVWEVFKQEYIVLLQKQQFYEFFTELQGQFRNWSKYRKYRSLAYWAKRDVEEYERKIWLR